MWNIVLEGLDFMWKTNTAKQLSKSLELKLVTKKNNSSSFLRRFLEYKWLGIYYKCFKFWRQHSFW